MIVIFNLGHRDSTFLTDSHGFVIEFYSKEEAEKEAELWIDKTQFRNFKIFKEND